MNLLPALTIALVITSTAVHAQDHPPVSPSVRDTISIRKNGWSTHYYYHRIGPLKKPQLMQVLSADPRALARYRKSAVPRTFGDIIGGAGGFLIGYNLGAAIVGRDINLTVLAAGAALIGASVPLTISGTRQVKQAVRMYNDGIKGAAVSFRSPELRLQIVGNGVGLALGF